MKSKYITFGGIMVALTSIILYSTSFIPINTLTILTLASAIIPICIIKSDIKTTIFVYIASSLIAFFIVPINISILYSIFFGIYGIIKFWAEKDRSKFEVLYKIVFFNIAFIIGFILFENILGIDIIGGIEQILLRFINRDVKTITFALFLILANVVFLVFDYALTLIISFYMDRIHPKIDRKNYK